MDTPMGNTGFGNTSASDVGRTTNKDICPTCGQPTNRGLEQFLGKLGISDEMINNLKRSFENVDLEEYLNTARSYLKDSGTKATTFAKENPGKVAAGVAVLAVGAGLLISALNKD
jgi:hypothetical protein